MIVWHDVAGIIDILLAYIGSRLPYRLTLLKGCLVFPILLICKITNPLIRSKVSSSFHHLVKACALRRGIACACALTYCIGGHYNSIVRRNFVDCQGCTQIVQIFPRAVEQNQEAALEITLELVVVSFGLMGRRVMSNSCGRSSIRSNDLTMPS